MTALLDATDTQIANLADLVAALQVAEATVSSMSAARDGLLAIAGRLAVDIAKQGDHPDRGDHSIRTIAAEIGAVQHVSDRTIERRSCWSIGSPPSGPHRERGGSAPRTPASSSTQVRASSRPITARHIPR